MELLERTFDPENGITEELWYDEATDKLVVNRVGDTSATLERNKRLQNEQTSPKFNSEVFNRVASIPLILVEKWLKEEPPLDVFNPEHAERLRKRLNDPDYAFLRTMRCKI